MAIETIKDHTAETRAIGTRQIRHSLDAAIIQGSLEGMVVRNIIESNRVWNKLRAEITEQGLNTEITEEIDPAQTRFIGPQTIFDSMIHADTLSIQIMEAQGD